MSGKVLYDGDCGMCTALAARLGPLLARRGYAFVSLEEESDEMRVLPEDGRPLGGADAVVFLASLYWWALPFVWAAKLPGAMSVLRAGYRWVAARRSCRHGACRLPASRPSFRWLPLFLAAALALRTRQSLPPWAFMWTLSIAVYFGFKLWMYSLAASSGTSFTVNRAFGFLFLWPGMDARAFAEEGKPGNREEWIAAAFKTSVGILFFFAIAPWFEQPAASGWCGMIGLVLMLHFGTFHLLSLAWRAAGVNAQPLMNSPLLAGSLGDFWGNRWNLAFRQIGYELVFAPYRRTIGAAGATAAIFLLSGLIHDFVISLPAGGGYGLPTLYFALQGAGVLAEKSRTGKAMGLGRGIVGRAFAITVAACPAVILFHPPFVARVMIPFMEALWSPY